MRNMGLWNIALTFVFIMTTRPKSKAAIGTNEAYVGNHPEIRNSVSATGKMHKFSIIPSLYWHAIQSPLQLLSPISP